MPVTTYDLPKALYILGGAPIGKQNIALGTTGARTIFQFPTQNFGIGKCAVFFCTFDNFSSTATTATANMGQSTVATERLGFWYVDQPGQLPDHPGNPVDHDLVRSGDALPDQHHGCRGWYL